ncbi:MAG TPA: hypothetical protein VGS20_14085 [Candidatus Acidoferrales bacterium]|nr:hypothetical protein [Candidatus Acidoferrales bacterium]
MTLYIDEAMSVGNTSAPYVSLDAGSLPKSIVHAYRGPGIYHLNATPKYGYRGCTGNVRFDLRVLAGGARVAPILPSVANRQVIPSAVTSQLHQRPARVPVEQLGSAVSKAVISQAPSPASPLISSADKSIVAATISQSVAPNPVVLKAVQAAVSLLIGSRDVVVPPQCKGNVSISCPGGRPVSSAIRLARTSLQVSPAGGSAYAFSALIAALTPADIPVSYGGISCGLSINTNRSAPISAAGTYNVANLPTPNWYQLTLTGLRISDPGGAIQFNGGGACGVGNLLGGLATNSMLPQALRSGSTNPVCVAVDANTGVRAVNCPPALSGGFNASGAASIGTVSQSATANPVVVQAVQAAVALLTGSGNLVVPPQCNGNVSISCPGGRPVASAVRLTRNSLQVSPAGGNAYAFSALIAALTPADIPISYGGIGCGLSINTGRSAPFAATGTYRVANLPTPNWYKLTLTGLQISDPGGAIQFNGGAGCAVGNLLGGLATNSMLPQALRSRSTNPVCVAVDSNAVSRVVNCPF